MPSMRWIMNHESWLPYPTFNTGPQFQAINLIGQGFSVRSPESWVISPKSSHLQCRLAVHKSSDLSKCILHDPVYSPWESMNHDSWILSNPTSNSESRFSIHLHYHQLYSLTLHTFCNKLWIMSHDSWVILPQTFLRQEQSHYKACRNAYGR